MKCTSNLASFFPITQWSPHSPIMSLISIATTTLPGGPPLWSPYCRWETESEIEWFCLRASSEFTAEVWFEPRASWFRAQATPSHADIVASSRQSAKQETTNPLTCSKQRDCFWCCWNHTILFMHHHAHPKRTLHQKKMNRCSHALGMHVSNHSMQTPSTTTALPDILVQNTCCSLYIGKLPSVQREKL